MSVALAAFLLLVPEVVMPRPLEVSAVSSDPVELERLATRLGPVRLLKLAVTAEAGGQPRVAAAALRGLGLAGSFHPEVAAQALLPLVELIELVGHTQDGKLLTAATEALVRAAQRGVTVRLLVAVIQKILHFINAVLRKLQGMNIDEIRTKGHLAVANQDLLNQRKTTDDDLHRQLPRCGRTHLLPRGSRTGVPRS